MTATTTQAPSIQAMLVELLAQGWTQKTIGRELGASGSMVGHWARGEREPAQQAHKATIEALWREGRLVAELPARSVDWRDAICRTDPHAWTEPATLAVAQACARACRAHCPLLDACEKFRLRCQQQQLPVAGVLAGRVPRWHKKTEAA